MVIKAKIRTWEDMENQYGFTKLGSVAVPMGFPMAMEKRMPSNRVILIMSWGGKTGKWKDKKGKCWRITKEMIEEIIDTNPN